MYIPSAASDERQHFIVVEAADASRQCAKYILRRPAYMADLLGYALKMTMMRNGLDVTRQTKDGVNV